MGTTGCMWEQAQAFHVLYTWRVFTNDADAHKHLLENWNWLRHAHPPQDWATCGNGTHANYASDDTAWDAGLAVEAYNIAHDPAALEFAKLAIRCAHRRWADGPPGTGLWYSDAHTHKSLYQAALALDSLAVFQLSGDKIFLQYALGSYTWMSRTLGRPDGLYWCDIGPDGPKGKERPNDIHLAGSVTFLGGDMAMGILEAKLFALTDDPTYKDAAIRGAEAILTKLVDRNGILIDDRDAWVNGYFVPDWVSLVIPLLPNPAPARQVILRTALAIAQHDRTPDGFYGGDWAGPADPAISKWGKGGRGSLPTQVMTSANAVDVIIAAYAIGKAGQ